ncbi:MAG: helix-hairpin-helix domain-containing protein [Atribacterota bacterium]|nr:helix-hairpin-helix domain-containing protein [Atribacterota bacterium]
MTGGNSERDIKKANIASLCHLYGFLRSEINNRLNLNFGLITVTIAFIGAVFGIAVTSEVHDFGIVGCFGLLSLQLIYLEYVTRVRDLSYYLFNIEEELYELGVHLPEGGWHHHIFVTVYEGKIPNEKKEEILFSNIRQKIHYVNCGIMVLFFTAYTFLNYFSFYLGDKDTKRIIIEGILQILEKFYINLSSDTLFWVIEGIAIVVIIVFIYIILKLEMKYKIVQLEECRHPFFVSDDEDKKFSDLENLKFVGHTTAKKLKKLGIRNAEALANLEEKEITGLKNFFGEKFVERILKENEKLLLQLKG